MRPWYRRPPSPKDSNRPQVGPPIVPPRVAEGFLVSPRQGALINPMVIPETHTAPTPPQNINNYWPQSSQMAVCLGLGGLLPRAGADQKSRSTLGLYLYNRSIGIQNWVFYVLDPPEGLLQKKAPINPMILCDIIPYYATIHYALCYTVL